MSEIYNIAIDGPAGAGKSTIAKAAAKRLGFIYVDTGAMYRAMALYIIRKGIDLDNEALVCEAADFAEVTISYEDGVQQVLLNGENVSSLIRTEEVSQAASKTSAYLPVREKLVKLQQRLAERESILMDGRDIGTCVLPHADLKIYLTASAAVRAARRHQELTAKGVKISLKEIEEDIIKRDDQDMHRKNSPLRPAEDAVWVDTSDMTEEQVIEEVLALAARKGIKGKR